MADIIRFISDFEVTGNFFYEGQEYEYYDKYYGMNPNIYDDCCTGISWIYRVKNDETPTGFDYIPDEFVIEVDEYSTETNHDTQSRKSRQEQWSDTVTKDEIENIYDVVDYVKAAQEFLGVDISAKDIEDKCDYAFNINYPEN